MSAVQDRASRFSIGGALLAALAASSCCLGPLLLVALGVGGAGAAGALGAFRPYLLSATAVLLALAFYLTYRRPRTVTGDACGCEHPRANRAGRITLWLATVVVLLVAAAPPLLARLADRARAPSSARADGSVSTATIVVEGIDCEACAAPLRKALTKVGGFHALELDIPKQSITVAYEPAPGRIEAYVVAINALGYEASLPSRSVSIGGRR
jgi:mercuric ion transport protein